MVPKKVPKKLVGTYFYYSGAENVSRIIFKIEREEGDDLIIMWGKEQATYRHRGLHVERYFREGVWIPVSKLTGLIKGPK
jgi:hypothetical protein